MRWDDFKIKTTEKCPRGVLYMHPDDAAEMRCPAQLVATIAATKAHSFQQDADEHGVHAQRRMEARDEQERQRLASLVQRELARRAQGATDR